jgi:hypothetical protein
MKRAILAAVALSFAATVAYAQAETTPSPPPKGPAAGGPEAAPPHHPGPEARGGSDGMDGPGMGGPGMHGPERPGPWMKHHMMMMSKGARIRVSDGDIHVNVKCAEDDSTAECGQTVIRILKQMRSSGQSPGYQDQSDENSGNSGGDDDQMMNE